MRRHRPSRRQSGQPERRQEPEARGAVETAKGGRLFSGMLSTVPGNRSGRERRNAANIPMGVQAMAADGLTTIRSHYGPKDTIEKLEAAVQGKGMTVFARIDHAAGAAEVGLSLRPTELLIFGNAKGGTPLMQSNQTIGIDLPLKALVWQDEAGNTWLSYNDPSWLAKRHGLGHEVEAAASAMTAALTALMRSATTSP
jgi:uncharacterized protein (DUF302 family)